MLVVQTDKAKDDDDWNQGLKQTHFISNPIKAKAVVSMNRQQL